MRLAAHCAIGHRLDIVQMTCQANTRSRPLAVLPPLVWVSGQRAINFKSVTVVINIIIMREPWISIPKKRVGGLSSEISTCLATSRSPTLLPISWLLISSTFSLQAIGLKTRMLYECPEILTGWAVQYCERKEKFRIHRVGSSKLQFPRMKDYRAVCTCSVALKSLTTALSFSPIYHLQRWDQLLWRPSRCAAVGRPQSLHRADRPWGDETQERSRLSISRLKSSWLSPRERWPEVIAW